MVSANAILAVLAHVFDPHTSEPRPLTFRCVTTVRLSLPLGPNPTTVCADFAGSCRSTVVLCGVSPT